MYNTRMHKFYLIDCFDLVIYIYSAKKGSIQVRQYKKIKNLFNLNFSKTIETVYIKLLYSIL